MAVQFERNINLEEIDSDALFGIEYLAHQTLGQKIILWGNVIIAVGLFVLLEVIYETSNLISFPVVFVFLAFGFLFGANQNENLTIAAYLKLLFFNRSKYISYKSTEDYELMRDEAKELKNVEKIQKRREESATPEGQRKSLIVVVILVASLVVFAVIMSGVKTYRQNHSVHHSVGLVIQESVNV